MKESYLAAEPMECLGSGEEVWRGVRAINPIEAIEKHNGSVRKLLPLKLRNMLTQRAPYTYRSAFKKGIDWCVYNTKPIRELFDTENDLLAVAIGRNQYGKGGNGK